MGRSAKLHKKPPNKSTASGTSVTATTRAVVKPAVSAQTPQEQKKRVGLKAKAGKRRKDADRPVLGGADYVDLMLGGRRKAVVEAAKLPGEEE